MKIDGRDLRLIMLGCFRYSLGRMTYMPSHTVDMIMKHKDIFRKFDWELFIREIKDTDDRGNIGMACDGNKWRELVNFCYEQLKETPLRA